MTSPTTELAAFAAGLRFSDIPVAVIGRTEELLVDWFDSTVAGYGARPVESITRFALAMGPQTGAWEMQTAVSALWGVAGWARVGRLWEAAI